MKLSEIGPDALCHFHIVCDPARSAPKLPPCPDCGREQSGALTLWDDSDPERPQVIDMELACPWCAMEDRC